MKSLREQLSLLLASLGLFCTTAPGQGWDPEIIDLFARIPVQEGGRVKPLESLASFTLLGMHGKRSLTTVQEETLTPMEWLLDTLFSPEAVHHQLFKVVDSETIEAIGVSTAGKRKSDNYSFSELQPGLDRLFNLASQHSQKEANQRTRVEGQLLNLYTNVNIFHGLQSYMQFARHHFAVPTPRLQQLFGGREVVHYSDLVERGPELFTLWQNVSAANAGDPERDAVERLLDEMQQHMNVAQYLALFPPDGTAEEEPEWRTAGEIGFASLTEGKVSPQDVELLRGFERMLDAQDMREFKQHLIPLSAALIAGAERRGEYGNIDLEVTYYRLGLTGWSQVLFLFGFLFVMLTWLLPRVRFLYHGGWSVTLVANLALTWAIVMRCIIRSRPPVSTLYETLLFITAIVVFVALVAEWITKRRIALSVGAILGVIGMFMANRFEGLDGVPRDTMPTLQAVLDTNFWLATHVTCITIGYAAGMLAAGIGSFYLLARLAGWQKGNRRLYNGIARMTYGVVCFGLLFSVVGTILGGIWANDSWGRFWGWDPKENGALLICLMNLAILHGRMGGFLRDHGVCTAAAFGGTVVAFSWFHVNQLGVGLHSYGFTEGVLTGLYSYYSIQWGIIALGFIPWLLARKAAAPTGGATA